MKPVKIGIIGCGVIGSVHASSAVDVPDVELVALADMNLEAANALAQKHNVPRTYASAEALIADDEIEAVILALITGIRTPIALQALAAGKHVLLEKPPALNADDLRTVIAAQNGLTVGCCSSRMTFLDGAEQAAAIVAAGRLGAIRVVRCRGLSQVKVRPDNPAPPPWRVSHGMNGGGYMVNWGVYDLNYLMHVTGWQLEPQTVLAQIWEIAADLRDGRVHPASDAENHAIVMIRCAGGEVLTLERGETMSIRDDLAWELTGELGSLRLNMLPYGEAPPIIHDQADTDVGLTTNIVLDRHGTDVQNSMPVRDFAQSIRTGAQPRTNLERALIIQRILDAVYASAASGTAVQL